MVLLLILVLSIFIVSLLGISILVVLDLFDEYSYFNLLNKFNKGYTKRLRFPNNIFEELILEFFGNKKIKEYIKKEKENL